MSRYLPPNKNANPDSAWGAVTFRRWASLHICREKAHQD